MKLIKSASKLSLDLNRSEWIAIGLTGGWIRKAENELEPPEGLPSIQEFFGGDLAPDPWVYFRQVLAGQHNQALIEAGIQYLERCFPVDGLRNQFYQGVEKTLEDLKAEQKITPDKQIKTLELWRKMLHIDEEDAAPEPKIEIPISDSKFDLQIPEKDFELSDQEFASKGTLENLRNEVLDLFNEGKIDKEQLQNRLNELAKSKPSIVKKAGKQFVKFSKFSWLVTGLKKGYLIAQSPAIAPPRVKPSIRPGVIPDPQQPTRKDPFKPRIPKQLPKPKATKPLFLAHE